MRDRCQPDKSPRPPGTRRASAAFLAVALLPAGAVSPASDAWVPFECAASAPVAGDDGGRAEARGPILTSDDEVTRAFERQVREILFGGRWRAALDDLGRSAAELLGFGSSLPPASRDDPELAAFLEALRTHSLDDRVERVVSWERARCGGDPGRQTAFYLEARWDGGLERALLSARGRLRSWSSAVRQPKAREPAHRSPSVELPTLERAAVRIAELAGGPVRNVQYVLASGYPRCRTIPCVAARRDATLYLLEARGRLFAFPLEPRPEDEILRPPGHRCLGAPCLGDPWVVAIGDRWLADGRVLGRP